MIPIRGLRRPVEAKAPEPAVCRRAFSLEPRSRSAWVRWTDSMDAKLRRLWAADTPDSAIAEELGISERSVVRRTYRLGLRPRAKPIQSPGPQRG
jgi:hypothetical protein